MLLMKIKTEICGLELTKEFINMMVKPSKIIIKKMD